MNIIINTIILPKLIFLHAIFLELFLLYTFYSQHSGASFRLRLAFWCHVLLQVADGPLHEPDTREGIHKPGIYFILKRL